MGYALAGAFVILLILLVVVMIAMSSNGEGTTAVKKGKEAQVELDVVRDHGWIKAALVKYRKENMVLLDEIYHLKEYLEPEQKIQWTAYGLTKDEKFLVVNANDVPNALQVLETIGNNSYREGDKLYLSFLTGQKVNSNDFEPVANFKIYPEGILNTMTNVTYDTHECKAIDGEIHEYKWEGALPVFDKPGEYVIKLKIKDKRGRWSKTALKKVVVVREEGMQSIQASGSSLFVLHKDGKVDAIGTNEYGQLGFGNINSYNERERIPHVHSTNSVSSSDSHTLFKRVNGTVWSVGRNQFGQLGTGNKQDVKVPKEIWGIKDIIQISAGETFCVALDTYGNVYAWGDNSHNQLNGSDKGSSKDIPQLLEGLKDVKQISAGANHTTVVKHDGTVFSWGDNQYGQLGLGYKGRHSDADMVQIKNIEKCISGKYFTLAIDKKGGVWGWGLNNRSQLGSMGQNEYIFPYEIPGLKNISDICTSGNYCLALDTSGNVFIWGQYNVLQDTYPERPVKLEGLVVKAIAAGEKYAYALLGDHRVIRWVGESNLREEVPIKKVISDDED